jgi:hypothetical protein
MAGTTPSDTPTVTPVVTPTETVNPHFIITPPPRPVLRPEQFRIVQSSLGPINVAQARGPVRGNGSDITVNPFTDVLRLGGLNSVRVLHNRVGPATINLRACSATISQTGVWSFAGGTGAYAHATGRGLFTLGAVAQFGNFPRTNTCDLTGRTPAQVTLDILGTGTVNPTFVAIGVSGTGLASR